jgi:hypothetical protein
LGPPDIRLLRTAPSQNNTVFGMLLFQNYRRIKKFEENLNKAMKILFVIEDKKGKNVLFITDSGNPLSINDAITATQNKMLLNTHIVNSEIVFIRSNPNKSNQDNFHSVYSCYILITTV